MGAADVGGDDVYGVHVFDMKKALLFVNKKKQKNFACWGIWLWRGQSPQEQKFFASFFKKEALALLFAPDAAGRAWMPAFAGMTGGGVRGLRRRADIF